MNLSSAENVRSLFAVIGYPINHSFSPSFFNEKFLREGLDDFRYEKFEIKEISALPALIRKYPNLRGLNVTSPWKEKIIPFLDDLSPEAAEIQAVNTVCISRDGDTPVLTGYNTDIGGFRDALFPMLKPHHKSALIFGSGGAARAVCMGLEMLGIEHKIVGRSRECDFGYSDVSPRIIEENTILINATPMGMAPMLEKYPEIPYHALGNKHLCYDLIYNPEQTLFLRKCKAQGATIANGRQMLINQALRSWNIWMSSNEDEPKPATSAFH